MKYNLLNVSTLLADNTSETRYDLITGGKDILNIDLFPRYDQFPFKSFKTRVWLNQKNLKSWEEMNGETVRATCDQVIPLFVFIIFKNNDFGFF